LQRDSITGAQIVEPQGGICSAVSAVSALNVVGSIAA
jgi:hypothetical protein